MPLSWRAELIQPALCSTWIAGEPPDATVDLAGVAYLGEEVEEVAGVGGREPRLACPQRPTAAAREPHRTEQAAEVVGGGPLPDSPARLAVDAERDSAREAAGGLRARRARSRRTSPCRRGRANASSRSRSRSRPRSSRRIALRRVGRLVVRVDQHPSQERVERGAVRGASRRRARGPRRRPRA